jgi:hypothetical protein
MSGVFNRKRIKSPKVNISICRDILEVIFNECDHSDIDETGGRIVGYYSQHNNKLNIKACGLIGPGPNARSSPTSFFQDGEYQESIFRKIEDKYPEIEHLGNWHTHHVNGLSTLSSGDIDTYTRIVNHEKHNTDFFYALLVVAKNKGFHNRDRYLVKHFLLKRGDSSVHEIPSSMVRITEEPPAFIDKVETINLPAVSNAVTINNNRAIDKEFISEMYPELKPFFSKKAKSLYWRGKLNLIDNTSVELFVLESIDEGKPSYSVTLSASSAQLFQCHHPYLNRSFDSAWKAIYSLERDLNREIFLKTKNGYSFNTIGEDK